MFGFDTVDDLLSDLKKTTDKLTALGIKKASHVAYLRTKADEVAAESERAIRVSNKLAKLIE